MLSKLPGWAKNSVFAQERFLQEYNPVFLVDFHTDLTENSAKGNVSIMVGITPTKAYPKGPGRFELHFSLNGLEVFPTPRLLALKSKKIRGAENFIEVSRVEVLMNVQQIFVWCKTKLSDPENVSDAPRGGGGSLGPLKKIPKMPKNPPKTKTGPEPPETDPNPSPETKNRQKPPEIPKMQPIRPPSRQVLLKMPRGGGRCPKL